MSTNSWARFRFAHPATAAHRKSATLRPGHESGGTRILSPRHCEEPLRRSNPDCLRGEILDCFRLRQGFGGQVAALAMTEYDARASLISHHLTCRHGFASSRRISPELCLVLPPSQSRRRREGRVLDRHPRSAARNAHARQTAQQHTGVADHSTFPARWSDGLCRALPGAELSFWPPSPFEFG